MAAAARGRGSQNSGRSKGGGLDMNMIICVAVLIVLGSFALSKQQPVPVDPEPAGGPIIQECDEDRSGHCDADEIDNSFLRRHKISLFVGAVVIGMLIYHLYTKNQDLKDEVAAASVRPEPWSRTDLARQHGNLGADLADWQPMAPCVPGATAAGYEAVPVDKRDMEWNRMNKLELDKLIDGAFAAVDSDADGTMSRKELECSPLGPTLLKFWANIDENKDYAITKEEWKAWCMAKKTELGDKDHKTFIVDMVWNADISIE